MTETDKRLSAYTDQIVHYLGRMAAFVEPHQYDYDEKVVESSIKEIEDKLRYLKQKLVIEHGGINLTQYPEKMPKGAGARPVICIETGKVYDSISQAAKDTGINGGNISSAVRGMNKVAGGFHWAAYEYEEEEDDAPRPTTARRPRSIPVLCVETMKIYPSAKAAEEETGISRSRISLVINGKKETAGGYHWRKYNSVVKQEEQEKLVQDDYSQDNLKHLISQRPIFETINIKHTVPVLCYETMAVYPSLKAAEEDTGISGSNISAAINERVLTAGGYHWFKVTIKD